MARELNGRVVAITGASSGIGAALAEACGRRGMRVAVQARRADRLVAAAGRAEAAGGEAEVVPGDVRDPAAAEELVTRAVRRWGRLDAIVANAGFGVSAPVAATPPEDARDIFDVNVLGTVWAIQAAWPVFEKQGAGHVVIVSSATAIHGMPANALYSATKAAQSNLAEGLRVEGEPLGIDVSVVYPVVTVTEFRDAMRDHTGRKKEAAARIGGPHQSAEEVAEAIVACLARPRFQVWPYRTARLMPWLEALSPRLLSRLIKYPEYYRRQMRG